MSKKSTWLREEPCLSVHHAIVSSLSAATKLRMGEESTATTSGLKKISLECGYANYTDSKGVWNLRHRAITLGPNELLGLDSLASFSPRENEKSPSPQKQLLRRPAQWVARIRQRNKEQKEKKIREKCIPLELVQLILRAAELSSMLKQAMNELQNGPNRRCLCWSRVDRREIDVGPILAFISELLLPSISCKRVLDGLLARAIVSVSDVAQSIAKPWADQWDVELKLGTSTAEAKSYPQLVLKAINSFICICLVDSRLLTQSMGSPDPIRAYIILGCVSTSKSKSAQRTGQVAADKVPRTPLGKNDNVWKHDGRILDLGKGFLEYLSELSKEHFCGTSRIQNTEKELLQSLQNPAMMDSGKNPFAFQVTKEVSESIDSRDILNKRRFQGPTLRRRGCPCSPESDNEQYERQPDQKKARTSSMGSLGDPDGKNPHPMRLSMGAQLNEYESTAARGFDVLQDYHGTRRVSSEMRNLPIVTGCMERTADDESDQDRGRTVVGPFEEGLIGTNDSTTHPSGHANSGFSADEMPQSFQRNSFGGSEYRKNNTADGDNSHSEWIPLSHIGHISDYHGLQRRHGSFVPLKFKNSVSEALEAIEPLLQEADSVTPDKEDAEISAEMKDYQRALHGYRMKQKLEREKRDGQATQVFEARWPENNDEFERLAARPILFRNSPPSKSNRSSSNSFGALRSHRESHVCTRHDAGTIAFWQDQQSSEERRSRTSELTELKRISIMMLREMKHTLKFIEEYNTGASYPYKKDACDGFHGSDSKIRGFAFKALRTAKSDQERFDGRHTGENSSFPAGRSSQSNKGEKATGAGEGDPVQLHHDHLITLYQELHEEYRTICPSPKDHTISALRECIDRIMEGKDNAACTDEEIVREEKAHSRIARGYKRKADQERIEKSHHEEERLRDLLEYEYLTRNKRPTPEEDEYEALESRPFRFINRWSPAGKRNSKSCTLGASCSLCAATPANYELVSNNRRKTNPESFIHNPRFRNVLLDYAGCFSEPQHFESRSASSAAEMRELPKVPRQKLEEMGHTIDFIETYNKGLIRCGRQ
eukprot:scaffold5517_cov135-Cylindrotheca_fusiformis.AAC.46